MGLTQSNNGVTPDCTVVATRDQVYSELDNEAVILHLQSGTYYGLNQVGARIWDMLRQPRKVAEILAAILDNYEVESARAERDLVALLQRLSDERLIEVVREADA